MKNTSISLGKRFQEFVEAQVAGGRFASASEVVREGLRLLEERETKLEVLREALIAGEESGPADYSLDGLISDLDAEGT